MVRQGSDWKMGVVIKGYMNKPCGMELVSIFAVVIHIKSYTYVIKLYIINIYTIKTEQAESMSVS